MQQSQAVPLYLAKDSLALRQSFLKNVLDVLDRYRKRTLQLITVEI
jgi:hypothetical protein